MHSSVPVTAKQPLLRRSLLNPFQLLSTLSEGRFWAYILVLPSLLLVMAVIIYPVLSGILISFQRYQLNRPDRTGFIGLQHYAELLQDPVFIQTLWNTLIWVTAGVLLQFALGLAMALCLNTRLRGMTIARVLILIPWILPTVVAGNIWALMLDSRLGVINDILVKMGLLTNYRAWFAEPSTAFPTVIMIGLWQGFPFFTLLLLAGLHGIADDLYEAAAVDGANRWERFWFITLPMLRPVIVAVTVLRTIGLVNSPDLIVILTSGGPGHGTEVLSSYGFLTAYAQFDFGYAGAISVVMLILLMIFTAVYVRVSGVAQD
ncbi:MAG: sugar ABC transporter permease [Anaerolineae bacterium]|nr:sugar ABC transporter permease [Anaerolineae bacterium]